MSIDKKVMEDISEFTKSIRMSDIILEKSGNDNVRLSIQLNVLQFEKIFKDIIIILSSSPTVEDEFFLECIGEMDSFSKHIKSMLLDMREKSISTEKEGVENVG